MKATLIDRKTIASLPVGTVIWEEYIIFDVHYREGHAVPEKDVHGRPVLSEHGLLPILICDHGVAAYEYAILDIEKLAADECLPYAPERFCSAKPTKTQIRSTKWAYDSLKTYKVAIHDKINHRQT